MSVLSRSAIRSARPRRSRAVAATTTASWSAALEIRVCMLPRRLTNRRSGRCCQSATCRLSEPVATSAPGGSAARVEPTRASRGSPRSGTAAITRPGTGADGRSLALWTAMSARPSRTALCTSLANTPLPPSSQIGTSSRRSPTVSTITSSTVTAGSAARRRAAMWSACQRASGLPRVAARTVGTEGATGAERCRRPARRTGRAAPRSDGRHGSSLRRPGGRRMDRAGAWR